MKFRPLLDILKDVLNHIEVYGSYKGFPFICPLFVEYSDILDLDSIGIINHYPVFKQWIIDIGLKYDSTYEEGEAWNVDTFTKIKELKKFIKQLEEEKL